MLRIALVVVAAVTCTLTGCGGGSSEQPEDPAAFCELYEGSTLVDAFKAAFEEPSEENLAALDEIMARYEEVAPSDISKEVSEYGTKMRELLLARRDGVDEASAEYRDIQAAQARSGSAVQQYGDEHCF